MAVELKVATESYHLTTIRAIEKHCGANGNAEARRSRAEAAMKIACRSADIAVILGAQRNADPETRQNRVTVGLGLYRKVVNIPAPETPDEMDLFVDMLREAADNLATWGAEGVSGTLHAAAILEGLSAGMRLAK